MPLSSDILTTWSLHLLLDLRALRGEGTWDSDFWCLSATECLPSCKRRFPFLPTPISHHNMHSKWFMNGNGENLVMLNGEPQRNEINGLWSLSTLLFSCLNISEISFHLCLCFWGGEKSSGMQNQDSMVRPTSCKSASLNLWAGGTQTFSEGE